MSLNNNCYRAAPNYVFNLTHISVSYFQSFYPLLKKASAANTSLEFSCSRAAVMNMSGMGSISDNTSGGAYPYRAAKVHTISVSRTAFSLISYRSWHSDAIVSIQHTRTFLNALKVGEMCATHVRKVCDLQPNCYNISDRSCRYADMQICRYLNICSN